MFLSSCSKWLKESPGIHQYPWEARAKMSTKVWKMESRWPGSSWLSKAENIHHQHLQKEKSKIKQKLVDICQNPRRGQDLEAPDSMEEWIRGGDFTPKNAVLYMAAHTGAEWPAFSLTGRSEDGASLEKQNQRGSGHGQGLTRQGRGKDKTLRWKTEGMTDSCMLTQDHPAPLSCHPRMQVHALFVMC